MQEIKDKVVIITGASSGIGLATAKLFHQKGAKLALVSNEKEKMEDVCRQLSGALPVIADMSKEDEVRAMVKKAKDHFGKIDVLINNAGRGYEAPIEKVDVKTFRYIFTLNVEGPLVAMQEVIPVMRSQGGGAIINISSGTALMFLPGMSVYSSSKRALVGMSLTAREELKKDNITVSVVYPFITKTDFYKNLMRGAGEEAYSDASDIQSPYPADSAEHVAEKIWETLEKGSPETFAHDWMENMPKTR
jgi:short-subunit dehydrogenase